MFKQENKTKTPEAFQTQSQPLKQSYTKLCEVALCRPVLVNANVKYKHHHLLPENPFLTFDVNASADVTGKQRFSSAHERSLTSAELRHKLRKALLIPITIPRHMGRNCPSNVPTVNNTAYMATETDIFVIQ